LLAERNKLALAFDAVDRYEAKLAASSLANAALRTALVEIWDSIPATYSETDPMVERHAKALGGIRAALALSADSLAQEVVAVLRDARKLLNVVGMWKEPVDEQWRMSWKELMPRLDALLARLGKGGPK
jgi:hypothetical protein